MYQCIGQRKTGGGLLRCLNESPVPSNVDHPEWGFLCSNCANAPAVRNGVRPEVFNASAMQLDIEEYKDQIESGIMLGIRGSERNEDGE